MRREWILEEDCGTGKLKSCLSFMLYGEGGYAATVDMTIVPPNLLLKMKRV